MELQESVEHLEHAAHGPRTRLRVIVTVLILAATVEAAVVGYMAATASSNADTTARERQLHDVAAAQATLYAAGQSGLSNDISADEVDAARRAAVRNFQAGQPGVSAADRAELAAETARWSAVQHAEEVLNPAGVDSLQLYRAKVGKPATREQQLADLAGEQTEAWVRRSDVYVAVVGLLAVALFLLGLALTVPRRIIGYGFAMLALGIGAYGGVRTVLATTPELPAMSDSVLSAYTDGVVAQAAGKHTEAIADYERAVKGRPHYAQAWKQLADSRNSFTASTDALHETVRDYQRAIAEGDRRANVYHFLAFTEMRLGHVGDALKDARTAHDIAPVNAQIDFALALTELLNGDSAGAQRDSRAAFALLKDQLPSDRALYFSQLRNDEAVLANAPVNQSQLKPFFLAGREAEASYDALGGPDPTPLRGATASISAVEGVNRTFYAFVYSNFAVGRVVGIRWYDSTSHYVASASTPALKWLYTPDGTYNGYVDNVPANLSTGTYTLELYLDGNFLSRTTVVVP